MGLRLHMATQYQVHYDDRAHFNWRCEELDSLLTKLEVEHYYDNSEDTASNMEINAEALKNALGELRSRKTRPSEVLICNSEDKGWKIDFEEFEKWAEYALQCADRDDGFIHGAWF